MGNSSFDLPTYIIARDSESQATMERPAAREAARQVLGCEVACGSGHRRSPK